MKQALRKMKPQDDRALQDIECNKALLERPVNEFSGKDESKLVGQIRQL
jgi:hypothetical protein